MVEEFKHTEIGEYPNDWTVEDFGEIISSVQLGGNYPNSDEDGEYILIKMGNLHRGYIDLKKKYYIKKGISPNEVDRLHFGDVMFNTRNTLDLVGKVAIWKNEANPAFFNSNIMRLKFNEEKISSNDFMNLILNTPKSLFQLRAIATGTTSVAAIYPRDLFKIKIPYPTKAEQTSIATSLNDADALIQKLEQLIAKKRNIKTGAIQELLKPKEGWEVKKLGEVLKVKHGKSQKAVVSENGAYPILASGGIIGKAISFLYNKPSVLIGRKGTIDEPQYMDTPFWSVDTLFYTEIAENYDAKFIFYMFNLINWYAYNEASGVPSLNAKTIELIEKYFPKTKSEQTHIAQILSDMDNEIQELEKQLEKYKMTKQGMMQSLLTGKIRLV